jgi:hypothetical protein
VLGAALAALATLLVLSTKPWDLPGGPGFFGDPEARSLRETVMLGLWWAALVNAVLCAVLLATLRVWARPLPATAPVGATGAGIGRRRRRAFGLAVLLAMVLALGLRLPLAQKSLWWDEGWTVRQVVVGWWYVPSDGTLQDQYFREGGLARALWDWSKPTNHVFYSVASWASLAAWRAATGAHPHAFDELAYRAPSLAASVLSVLVVALLLRGWGLPRAALFAAFLLAIHPWHVRYGVDGRAYGLVVLFALTSALGLSRWLRSGGWHDLALLAASQLFMIWTYPYAAFVTAGLGATGMLALVLDRRPGAVRLRLAMRLGVAHVLVGMALFQLMAPNLTQTVLWDYDGGVARHDLVALWSGLTVGMLPFGDEASFADGIPSLELLMAERPWMRPVVFAAMPLLIAVGFARLCLRGRGPAAALAGIALAAPLGLGATEALDQHFYARFLSFLLPAVVICLAASCDLLVHPLARGGGRASRAAAGLALAALLAGYQAMVWPQTRLLASRPYAAMRDVVEFMDAQAPSDDSLRVGVGLGGGMPRIYDPTILYVEEAGQLAKLCRDALDDDRTFLVFYGYAKRNARRYDAVALVEDARWFEPIGRLLAIEPNFGYRVFRARGDACPPVPTAPARTGLAPRSSESAIG